MKQRFGSVVPLCLLFAGLTAVGSVTAMAQDQNGQVTPPPKVLEVITEYVKPGQAGSPHEKSEGAFAQAMRDAKWPTSYIGMNALTGRQRAVFFVGYDSFAAWGKDNADTAKNTTLAGALDSATIADGSLLSDVQTSVYHYRDELSLRPGADIGHVRFFDITVFHVRAGHEKDWDTLAKMYKDAFDKMSDVHWDTFEKMYGTESGNTFMVVTPIKSLDEVDQSMMNDKKLHDSVGDQQMQKMMELGGATIESSESILLAVNPKMSYANDAWTNEDPDFWNQR